RGLGTEAADKLCVSCQRWAQMLQADVAVESSLAGNIRSARWSIAQDSNDFISRHFRKIRPSYWTRSPKAAAIAQKPCPKAQQSPHSGYGQDAGIERRERPRLLHP